MPMREPITHKLSDRVLDPDLRPAELIHKLVP